RFGHPLSLLLGMLAPEFERRLEVLHGRVYAATDLVAHRARRGVDLRLDDFQRRLHARLLDLRQRRGTKIGGQSEELERADHPLRRIPLIPVDAVAEVGGEAVMEAV